MQLNMLSDEDIGSNISLKPKGKLKNFLLMLSAAIYFKQQINFNLLANSLSCDKTAPHCSVRSSLIRVQTAKRFL